jgi:hypothetical protein
MNDNSDYRPPMRSTGVVIVGVILLVAAILLGLMGLPLALDDPCSGVTGCDPIVDMRPIGWMLVVSALLIGLPGAWMAHWGSRPSSD